VWSEQAGTVVEGGLVGDVIPESLTATLGVKMLERGVLMLVVDE
jgi:hypothetical protein